MKGSFKLIKGLALSVVVVGVGIVILFCLPTQVMAASDYKTRDGMCSMDDSSINRMESDHFQIVWGNADTTGEVNEELVKGNLTNLETIRSFYMEKLNMKDTSVSAWANDKTPYKTNVYISNTGLTGITDGWAYMTTDAQGYAIVVVMPGAMRVDEPSWVLPHEYAHAIVYHQGGVVPNEWAEPLANWYRDQFLGSDYYRYGDKIYGPASDFFAPMILKSDYYFPHIVNYYDAWPVLLYVSENPDNIKGLGLETMIAAIKDKTTDENNMLDRIARLSGVSVQDILGYYSRRMVTLDFCRQSCYQKYLTDLLADNSNYDKIYTTLTKDGEWLKVPDDRAPMQQGYNVIPLEVSKSAKQVIVDFESTSSEKNAAFRVNIVAKTADNKTTYSKMFENGKGSLALTGSEEKVYLVVCATPSDMKQLALSDENAVGPRYTYRVKVSESDKVADTANDTDTSDNEDKNTTDEQSSQDEYDNEPATGDIERYSVNSFTILIVVSAALLVIGAYGLYKKKKSY